MLIPGLHIVVDVPAMSDWINTVSVSLWCNVQTINIRLDRVMFICNKHSLIVFIRCNIYDLYYLYYISLLVIFSTVHYIVCVSMIYDAFNYSIMYHIWWFPKIGVPKSSISVGFSLINHLFWGTPHCRKPPYNMLYSDLRL